MRSRIHPGWKYVEIRQQVFAVELITCRRRWDMAHRYEFIGSVFALDGISSDQECGVGGLCFKERFAARFADCHMTAITACVGH